MKKIFLYSLIISLGLSFTACEDFLKEDTIKYTISFNGKARFTLDFPADADNDTIQSTVMGHELAQKWIEGKTPKKVIIVPKKIVNIVL